MTFSKISKTRSPIIGKWCLVTMVLGALIAATPGEGYAKRTSGGSHRVQMVKSNNGSLPWRRAPAHSIFMKDLASGRVLYQHESEKRLSPASLTKIMSALVILEKGQLEDLVTVSPTASRAHKTHLRLKPGQVFRLDDLLKGMLIMSANDACLAAVEHVGGDEAQFVTLMNAKAEELGLRDTHFSNACGFDHPDHYSTAEDLARLSVIALGQPTFRQLVREERAIIVPVNGSRAYVLHNTNRLLGRIPGVEGVKTGFTSKAGRCLIAKVSQNGSELLLVILNSNRRWNTAVSLINYGLRTSDTIR
ncbi:putative D-alanyl-D-alanine carboxypeptidase [Nitrospira sp. KM1]|uniref:D-alanyl-D-alanine carboxypeptidase family protein n=1 Tax=Nitrospira sp. KM1 TaxID=1936990 RepID=UPI0013A75F7D|nr:D-alanyl-D-alanine carboxypeptidase family protein [Nitrospira sp. KM1]BCA55572.1 putative D-alanyl-D-alanine carboxypeptidase [Nitrospira sp. KM1]